MSAQELVEWMAYERVTGTLGPERADLLAGIISATIASGLGKRRFAPRDFLPVWDHLPQQTWQEQLAVVIALNRQYGGSVNGNNS